VPTVVINARDDPLIAESCLPANEEFGDHIPVRLVYHDEGGHCGFWTSNPPAAHGWLAEEMARVLEHFDSHCKGLGGEGGSTIDPPAGSCGGIDIDEIEVQDS
jgi:predicted alpha/beta-fold hydrolase